MPHASRVGHLSVDHEVGRGARVDTQGVHAESHDPASFDQVPCRLRAEAGEPQVAGRARIAHGVRVAVLPAGAEEHDRAIGDGAMRPLERLDLGEAERGIGVITHVSADVDDRGGPDERRGVHLVEPRGPGDHVARGIEMGAGVLSERHLATVEPVGNHVDDHLERWCGGTRPHDQPGVDRLGEVHDLRHVRPPSPGRPSSAGRVALRELEHAEMRPAACSGPSLEGVRLRGPHRGCTVRQVAERPYTPHRLCAMSPSPSTGSVGPRPPASSPVCVAGSWWRAPWLGPVDPSRAPAVMSPPRAR